MSLWELVTVAAPRGCSITPRMHLLNYIHLWIYFSFSKIIRFLFSAPCSYPPVFQGDSTVVGTSKLRGLYELFEEELVRRQERAKDARPKWEPPKTKLDEDPGK